MENMRVLRRKPTARVIGIRNCDCRCDRSERKYDVPLIEAEYKLDAVPAEAEVAAALRVKQRSPIFRIERTSYSRQAAVQSITKGCTTEGISSASLLAWSERCLVELVANGGSHAPCASRYNLFPR